MVSSLKKYFLYKDRMNERNKLTPEILCKLENALCFYK